MAKTKNSKVKDFFIRAFMIIAIFVVIVITYNFINNLQRIKLGNNEFEFFQYLYGKKIEYSGVLEISEKNEITKLETNEGTIYLESMPVYYKNEKFKVLLPQDMAAVFPLDKGRINKVNSLATVYIEYGDVYVQKGDLNKKLEDAFLYDGNDLYFFIENTTVSVNGEEYKLSPLSYINVTYKGYIEIYDYDTDDYKYIEESEEDVIANTSDYTINLTNDTVKYDDTEQILLKRVKTLPNLEND